MAGLALPLLPLLLLALLLPGLLLLRPGTGFHSLGVVAILEVVVRHVEAVANAALDRLHRRAVTVLAQILVGFGRPAPASR